MKKVAIMQPYFFPYLGYFQMMSCVDEFIIYDDVNYIKQGWINRNNILVGDKKQLFTISVSNASVNKHIKDIEIADSFERIKKTLVMAYHKAPYFQQTFNLLEGIFSYGDNNLARFVGNSLITTAKYLDMQTQFRYSSVIQKDHGLPAQEKVILLCKDAQANMYINAIGGMELYNKEDFRNNGIELKFIKSNLQPYKQFKGEFVPGLSMIDILMFNSPGQIREMLSDYELI